MKFNAAVLAVLAVTLAGAPLIVSAADNGGGDTTAAPAKAKHHAKHHSGKKSTKKSTNSSSDAPK